MATFEEHCQDCQDQLGERFEAVHRWLDELQADYGAMHRPFRHNTEAVEQIRRRWGDSAALAAQIHIRRDTGGTIPTKQQLREYWGIHPEDIRPEDD